MTSAAPGSGLRLTRRGWELAAGAAGLVTAARLFGVEELYAIAAAAVSLLAVAVLWSRSRRLHVEVSRRLHPSRIEGGEQARVDVAVRNRSVRSVPVLALRDPFDGGRRTAELLVAPVGGGELVSAQYRLPPTGRGVFTLGPLSLEVADPFGLVRHARVAAPTATLIVHPVVERLGRAVPSAGNARRAGRPTTRPGSDNDEFASLREYVAGDDPRKVHWVSSARSETLLVREDQMEQRGRVTIVVDLRSSMWSPPAFERALVAAASIVDSSLSARLQVRLLTTAGTDSGSGSGPRHRARILDALAAAQPHDPVPASVSGLPGRAPARQMASRTAAGDAAVVISSDRATLSELPRIAGGRLASAATFVVVEERSASPAGSRSSRIGLPTGSRVVRVGLAGTFAAAWDRAA